MLIVQVERGIIAKVVPVRGQQNNDLQNARRENAPCLRANADGAAEENGGGDQRKAERKAGQLRGQIVLLRVQHGGKHDGGDEKHQRREHDAAEGYGQIVRFLGKAGVDDMNQRPGEQHHKQADQQRERGEQVQRVAREAMRALGPELVFAANVERNQRAGDARGKQKHRQVKQAVGGIVRVRNAVAAEIKGHDHFTNETDGLRHKDDQRHRQRRSHQMIALRSHFRTSISDCAVPGRDSFSVYRKEGGFNTGKPACLGHTEIIP